MAQLPQATRTFRVRGQAYRCQLTSRVGPCLVMLLPLCWLQAMSPVWSRWSVDLECTLAHIGVVGEPEVFPADLRVVEYQRGDVEDARLGFQDHRAVL